MIIQPHVEDNRLFWNIDTLLPDFMFSQPYGSKLHIYLSKTIRSHL